VTLVSEVAVALLPIWAHHYRKIPGRIEAEFPVQSVTGNIAISKIAADQRGPDVDLLISLPKAFLSISSLTLVPLSRVIGRRPIIMVLAVVSITSLPWIANSSSFTSHVAALCFQAFGTGAVLAMGPLIIQDMTFLHERNRALGFLMTAAVSVV
jgi:predicted MFS family arabinose efflux permease